MPFDQSSRYYFDWQCVTKNVTIKICIGKLYYYVVKKSEITKNVKLDILKQFWQVYHKSSYNLLPVFRKFLSNYMDWSHSLPYYINPEGHQSTGQFFTKAEGITAQWRVSFIELDCIKIAQGALCSLFADGEVRLESLDMWARDG